MKQDDEKRCVKKFSQRLMDPSSVEFINEWGGLNLQTVNNIIS